MCAAPWSISSHPPESPHNVYLALADGLGLPALALYLALVAAAIVGTLRILRRGDSVNRLVAAALLMAIADHVLTDGFMTGEPATSWLFWAFLGVVVGVPRARGVDRARTTTSA